MEIAWLFVFFLMERYSEIHVNYSTKVRKHWFCGDLFNINVVLI